MNFYLLILLTLGFPAFSQETVDMNGIPCDIHGSARNHSLSYSVNAFKNRYSLPAENDFDSSISFNDLSGSADANQFPQDKAIKLVAYVFNVKSGGVESCNCRNKDPRFKDTHVELIMDEDSTNPGHRLIVEITPRIRAVMAEMGTNWSTVSLKRLKGHKVEISGWLFYDADHENEAVANDPRDEVGKPNWRGTCWEIHPVTGIKILDRVDEGLATVVNNETRGSVRNSRGRNSKSTLYYISIFLIFLIFSGFLMFLLKRK